MWKKVKPYLVGAGAALLAVIAFILGRNRPRVPTGGADVPSHGERAERVGGNIAAAAADNRDATEIAADIAEQNSESSGLAAQAIDDNRRAREILERIRKRNTGASVEDIGD